MSNEVEKKTAIVEEVTDELMDKFHRALCPQCNGKCHMGSHSCGYDYTHKMSPAPGVNEVWKRYLLSIQGAAEVLNMSFDDVFELLTDENENDMSNERYDIKMRLQELWRMC
ncbi:MAG: hypothetical protein Q4D02_02275 [Clostridia bacterium]|nr:hypothetical protein [Clostridia bacterium]